MAWMAARHALTSFVGRSTECEELSRLIERARIVSVVGSGGVGKTRLVWEVIERLAGRAGHPVVVDLAVEDAASDPVAVVARAVGVRAGPDADLSALLLEALQSAPGILVLDNCEHVIESFGALAVDLVSRAPMVRVLVTSRRPLGVPGETVFRLRSLPTDEGVALFVDRARQSAPAFDATHAEAVVLEICRELEGLPLAIELAAATVGVAPLSELRDGLRSSLELLTGGRDRPARHRTLAACVEWSLASLDSALECALERLSVLRTPWTIDVGAALLEGAPRQPLALILELAEHSLIESQGGEPARFRMPVPVREHVVAGLLDEPASAELGDIHGRVFADRIRAQRSALETAELQSTVRSLQVEFADITAALEHLWGRGDCSTVRGMLADLALFWTTSGRWDDAQHWFSTADTGTSEVSDARFYWAKAYVAAYTGEFDHAVATGERAIALARSTGDTSALARALDVTGFASLFVAPHLTEDRLREAVAVADTGDDTWCRADAAQILAYFYLNTGQVEQASEWFAHADPLVERTDNAQLRAWQCAGQGMVAAETGAIDAANHALVRATDIADDVGDPNIVCTLHAFKATVHARQGEMRDALDALDDVLARSRRLGAGQARITVAATAIDLAHQLGDNSLAEQIWLAEADWLASRAPAVFATFAATAATVAAAQGRPADEADRRRQSRLATRRTLVGAKGHQRTGWDSLTPAERRVAERAAQGLSNREIAADLTIGAGTVKSHLEHVYVKLGVANRTRLSAFVHRLTEH